MRHLLFLFFLSLGLVFLGGCATLHYDLSEADRSKDRIKHLGQFTVEAAGCGSFMASSIGQEIIKPAVEEKLRELGANAADHIVAKERWYDIPLGMLIIPAVLGCSNWAVTGDALLVEKS
jgi:hypothetical protein